MSNFTDELGPLSNPILGIVLQISITLAVILVVAAAVKYLFFNNKR